MSVFCLVYVTCPNEEVALQLGQDMVKSKLAACANILPHMTSIYPWEGQLETSHESVLILKTKAETFPRLETNLAQQHPYEVPCILQLPITAGNQGYFDWLSGTMNS